jgi:hypothetical protein
MIQRNRLARYIGRQRGKAQTGKRSDAQDANGGKTTRMEQRFCHKLKLTFILLHLGPIPGTAMSFIERFPQRH